MRTQHSTASGNTPRSRVGMPVCLAMNTTMLMLLAGCPAKETESPQRGIDAAAPATAEVLPASVDPAPPTPPQPTVSATLRREELLGLVFPPQPLGQPPRRTESVQLPDIDDNGKRVSYGPRDVSLVVEQVVRLDDAHAVMLTSAVPVNEHGAPENGHAAGAWLGAYFFERGDEGWKLRDRNESVDNLGYFGRIGHTGVERIAPDRFVLTIDNGSCAQGYCDRHLWVYELGPASVRKLADALPTGAENIGAIEGCEAVLDGRQPEQAPTGACYRIRGKFEFAPGTRDAPGELHVALKGRRTRSAKDLRVQTVDTAMIYSLRGDGYALVMGQNPMPR